MCVLKARPRDQHQRDAHLLLLAFKAPPTPALAVEGAREVLYEDGLREELHEERRTSADDCISKRWPQRFLRMALIEVRQSTSCSELFFWCCSSLLDGENGWRRLAAVRVVREQSYVERGTISPWRLSRWVHHHQQGRPQACHCHHQEAADFLQAICASRLFRAPAG